MCVYVNIYIYIYIYTHLYSCLLLRIYIYIYNVCPQKVESQEGGGDARSGVEERTFKGWSNNHFNNLHVILSLEIDKTLHVSNTQGI